jgi:hypothetical protein
LFGNVATLANVCWSTENSGEQQKTAAVSLFFGGSKRPDSRISAANEIPLAVNFVEKQRKTARRLELLPLGGREIEDSWQALIVPE